MASHPPSMNVDWAAIPPYDGQLDLLSLEEDDDDAPPPPYQQSPPPHQIFPPTPPSLGYIPDEMATVDMTWEVGKIRKALEGLITDKKDLINILSRCDPPQLALLRQSYKAEYGRSLAAELNEVSGHTGEALAALARGPLVQDADNMRLAVRYNNNNPILDVFAGRSNADIEAIKRCYRDTFGEDLVNEVSRNPGWKGRDRLEIFTLIFAAARTEESVPVDPVLVEKDAQRLWQATNQPGRKHLKLIFRIITSRSNNQLREICRQYQGGHRKRSLKKDIRWKFNTGVGDDLPRNTLLLILRRAVDPVKTDAKLLEECMMGFGTKDTLLLNRIIRLHWDRGYLEQVKKEYHRYYSRALEDRVASDTSGHLRDLMLKLLK